MLSVRPVGLYLEYGLYLTFSARGTTYKPSDSLEVVLRFELPEGAIVHDSWLWINDNISRAIVLDRWTASSIYEDIVRRNQDPSILFKNSPTDYELRVFPMRGDEQREVKITYLMPMSWTREEVEAQLPTPIIRSSRFLPAQFNILVWPSADWKNPRLAQLPQVPFVERTDLQLGTYLEAVLSPGEQLADLRLILDSPLKKGPFAQVLPEGTGGFYQIAVMPDRLFGHEVVRKLLLLIDYEQTLGPAAIQPEELMDELKNQMKKQLFPYDSFNIIVSNINPRAVSNHWMPATPDAIDQAFASARQQLANFSNLPPLLGAGIQFIQERDRKGVILLATNTRAYTNNNSVNTLVKGITELMGEPYIRVVLK